MEKIFSDRDISIIVPIYNVEEYLEECLHSLLHQTKDNIEVIMINDGSTDSSGEIAKKYAQKYKNFLYFYKENGGLGCARNYGVKRANGKYIAFVDSDDVVSLDLYEKMFTYAERNQSELTICNAARLNSSEIWDSNLHKKAFKDISTKTHITENPNLIYDTVSWNKLILKSFYEKNHFQFPENILYEDIPVTIPMHFKANNVSVVENSYYFWRVRDGATKSITQCANTLINLQDRIKILKMLDTFFTENNIEREYCLLKQKKALDNDLMIFVNQCKHVPEKICSQMLQVINAYISEAIEEYTFDMLPIISQQKYVYVKEYNIEKLIEVIDYQGKDYYNAKIEEKGDTFIVTLPDHLFTISSRNITDELSNYEPKKNITSIKPKPDGYEIKAYIYKKRMNINNCTEQEVSAYLENELTGFLTPLDAISVKDESVTESFGTVFDAETNIGYDYNYDGSSFQIKLDLNNLEINNGNEGYNRLLILYKNRLAKGKIHLSSSRKLAENKSIVLNNKYIRLQYDELNELRVYLKSKNNFADFFAVDDKKIQLTLTRRQESLFAKSEQSKEISFKTEDYKTFHINIDYLKEDTIYYLFIKERSGLTQELFYRDRIIQIEDSNNLAVIFMTNHNNQVRFIIKNHVTYLDSQSRNGKIIHLKTKTLNKNLIKFGSIQAYLYVNDDIAGERTILGESKCTVAQDRIECDFSINFNNERIIKNFYTSQRDLHICYEENNGQRVYDNIYSDESCKMGIKFNTLKIQIHQGKDGNIQIKARNIWKKEENNLQKRKTLIAKNYPEYRKEKINPKCIIFESMWGEKYSCNPQHLYEYINQNYPQYKCVWSLNDERIPIKGNGIRVRRLSQEYYYYLATAKYLINNVNFPDQYIKREGQIEIQTMHGTPLKTLGLDVVEDFPNENSRKKYINKNSRWDYLIVQGEFMKSKAYSCFNFEKKILNTGYPRTDFLFRKDKKQVLNIKKKLCLPLDKKIILYAPTWRTKGTFHMQLDLQKLKEKFADEYILLIRLHHFSTIADDIEIDNKFTFDLQSYRCIEDLYQISDLLITDYSSVMFDYILLDKPMIFFIYDLENYRDHLRGIYVDIEKEAPGPIVFDTDAVINVLNNIDTEMEKCSDRINIFKEKYVGYENPDSCEKIVKQVIKPNQWISRFYRLKQKIKSYIKQIMT